MEGSRPQATRFEELIKKMHERIAARLSKVKYKLIVMSGKGGVGKSTVTVNLAASLAMLGRKVGILDADMHGPSVATMLGMKGSVLMAGPVGIIPAIGPLGIKVVSIEFLLPSPDTPTIWRGPMKANALRQLLAEVEWGPLDYLIVDLPPGTGDEPLSIAQLIPDLSGAILVTIPSYVSEHVVRKAFRFAEKLGIPVLCIVENMSYFKCPQCGSMHYLFGKGGGKRIAESFNVGFIVEIPLDPRIASSSDEGVPFVVKYAGSEAAKIMLKMAKDLARRLEEGQPPQGKGGTCEAKEQET